MTIQTDQYKFEVDQNSKIGRLVVPKPRLEMEDGETKSVQDGKRQMREEYKLDVEYMGKKLKTTNNGGGPQHYVLFFVREDDILWATEID